MATRKPIFGQPENRNFLSPTGFTFMVNRAPHLQFFGRKVNVPSISHDYVVQENYLRGIPLPGTRLEFEDLSVEFLVDEDLQNYMEIHKWLYGIGFPDSLKQIYDWQNDPDSPMEQSERSQLNLYSDGTMNINNSSNIPSFKVKFQNLFPISLTTLDFDASLTDLDYMKAVATFKYTYYTIEEITSCC
jgi:hypothetical protein|tara:strand:+ start:932 stop:1495 length:564 start_codon:yes stop_codon:yes gene_type:complete